MIIPATNAPAYIGHINPGVAYWWFQTNGQWFLWLPDPPSLAASWPRLVVAAVGLAAMGIAVVELNRRSGVRNRGCTRAGSQNQEEPDNGRF